MDNRILVVDDDPVITKGLHILLKNAGYTTELYRDGDDVVAVAAAFKPNLILLDVMLGGPDGRDIACRLRETEKTRKIPIILISANQYMQHDFGSCGARAFISKPFKSEYLLKLIKKFCPDA